MSAATKYQLRGPLYDAVRCPVHQRVVAVRDGKLAGRCDLCAGEAARGLSRLAKMAKARR